LPFAQGFHYHMRYLQKRSRLSLKAHLPLSRRVIIIHTCQIVHTSVLGRSAELLGAGFTTCAGSGPGDWRSSLLARVMSSRRADDPTRWASGLRSCLPSSEAIVCFRWAAGGSGRHANNSRLREHRTDTSRSVKGLGLGTAISSGLPIRLSPVDRR
jgi:hypothetical protein